MQTKNVNWLALLVAAATVAFGAWYLASQVKSLISGAGNYSDHWFFVLIAGVLLSWITIGPRELVFLRSLYRTTQKKIASVCVFFRRQASAPLARIRNLAGLFFLPPSNRPQTEP